MMEIGDFEYIIVAENGSYVQCGETYDDNAKYSEMTDKLVYAKRFKDLKEVKEYLSEYGDEFGGDTIEVRQIMHMRY